MSGGLPASGDVLDVIRNLERRVRKIETQDREKTEYYNVNTGETELGRQFKDGDGNTIYSDSDAIRGRLYPGEHTQWIVPVYQTVTSDTWVTLSEIEMQMINHDLMQFTAACSVASGTRLGVRIRDGYTGLTYGEQEVDGAVGGYVCEWIHPYKIGWGNKGDNASSVGENIFLQLQVRNVNNTGTIFAYTPRSMMLRNSRLVSNASDTTPFTFS